MLLVVIRNLGDWTQAKRGPKFILQVMLLGESIIRTIHCGLLGWNWNTSNSLLSRVKENGLYYDGDQMMKSEKLRQKSEENNTT